MLVCPADYDPKPDTLYAPRVVPEGLPVPNARPEQPIVAVGTVTPDQL